MPPLSASAIVAEGVDPVDFPSESITGPHAPCIRLLLITDTSIEFSGGSERFLRNLVTLLPHDRYQITVVQLDAGHHLGASAHPLGELQHVRLLSLPVEAIYGNGGRNAWRQLQKMIRLENYDIVQSHHEKSDLLTALLPFPAGCVRISNRRDMGYKKSAKLKWLFRLINHRFDRVIAPAQPILSELAHTESLDSSKSLWIPNGVDTQKFRPRQGKERSALRESLGLADEAIAFGCIARMTPEKRHVDLLAAFAQLHATAPHSRLLLIGEGPLHDEIQRQVASLSLADSVTLMGMRPDIESVLPALDAGLLVSSTEGMSNAILEMMSSGLPVIATAVGGNPSLVAHEVSGLLVPECRPELLAQAMTSLALAPERRHEMGRMGRSRIEREFSLQAMVQSFDQTYQLLLQDAGMRACAVTP